MSEPPDELLGRQRDRDLELPIVVALLFGLLLSTLSVLVEYRELVFLLFPALVVFWSWVGLGTCAGMLVVHKRISRMTSWQAYTAALVTSILCGLSLFTGAHDYALQAVRQALSFQQDLGNRLIWLQVLYFVVAALASFLASLSLISVASRSGA